MKMLLLLSLAAWIIGLALPAVVQEQNTVDPEVRQQIEAVLMKAEEAYNKYNAAAFAALFTQDATEVWGWLPQGGAASGQQSIERKYAVHFASNPGKQSFRLVQVYAIGKEICAISEFSHHSAQKGYAVTICARDGEAWKIRMAYAN